ncbi:MAG: NADH-quinone oxidoreductase subunit C [Gammaproteobacteria bacterium]|nr:NADH-quinone oxidoreductase subunit C [Gammaproteobacteria bacterium]
MAEISTLLEHLQNTFAEKISRYFIIADELTIEIPAEDIRPICYELRDNAFFGFDMLMDLCGVDYSAYGFDEWEKESATLSGFSRGVLSKPESMPEELKPKSRFAVVYHLLSIKNNHRLSVRVYVDNDYPIVDSVIDVWNSADWYEREAFDLYGILFKDHPDLRRLLTDYGFIGHPFRKDFPLIGNVEMRYDATAQRCIYEPVSIIPRTLVPKVIREDHRYIITEEEGVSHG